MTMSSRRTEGAEGGGTDYVAALLMSALQLLRYVLIFVGRNNRGRRDN